MPNHQAKPANRLLMNSGATSAIAIGGMSGAMTGGRSVPLLVPLLFLLTGAVAAALFSGALPWIAPEALLSPGFPHVLALVHTATLGWLTMTIMGASLQLVPVIVVAPLRATRFLYWHYPIYAGGALLLISGFWQMVPWLLVMGGALIVLAVIHHVIILAFTLAHATKRPLTARFLIASLCYLCIVVSLGLTAALNFQFGFLGPNFDQVLLAHITLGVVGWLSTTLIGVSYTLVRMFALAHEHTDRLGNIIFVLLNAGIILLALGLLLSWRPVILCGGGILIAAAWMFACDYWRMLRVRRRKLLDTTQYHGIAAVVYFALSIPVGVAAALFGWLQPGILAALALAALVGWLGQSTTGYLYKIVPFLIWHHRYGPLVGRQKVPLMREMLHQRWARLSWWLINAGLAGAIICALGGWLVPMQFAAGVMAMGFLLVAVNVVGIVRHLRA